MKAKLIIVSFGLIALTACAATKEPPTTEMALAESAIEQATDSGAHQYAPLELKMAQEKFAAATTAMQNKDNAEAERLLEQAAIDAKLANAKTNTAKTQQAVDELQNSIDLLRQEIQRKLPQ